MRSARLGDGKRAVIGAVVMVTKPHWHLTRSARVGVRGTIKSICSGGIDGTLVELEEYPYSPIQANRMRLLTDEEKKT